MRHGFVILLLTLASSLVWTGCTDNSISSAPGYKLHFSQDTIAFDTVFSTIGSSTRQFIIYNRNPRPLSISSISLPNGTSSGFSIMVDGRSLTNNQLTDVEIRAHDSLFVFVNVTVNPTLQDNPLFITDSVVFMTNGNRQSVKLTAYGQDAVIFKGKTIHNDTLLSAAKPHLIYDYLAIAPSKTLSIASGAKFYFHKNAALQIYGNLKAEGKMDARITFRGDRSDKLSENVPYSYLSGQWRGIEVLGSSSTVSLNHTILMSGKNGILIPNGTQSDMPRITINNSKIQNFDSCGIVACNAILSLLNSEVSNCRTNCLSLTGGNYTLTHSTIANFYNDLYAGKQRDGSPALRLSNEKSSDPKPAPVQFQCINSIITGSMPNEISITDTTRNIPLIYSFDHCYLMAKPFTSASLKKVLWGNSKDLLFIKTSITSKGYCDFRPTKGAPIRKQADILVSQQAIFKFDMNDISRLWDGIPDLGAYEWPGE
jgi:hypothetical protein